MTAPSAGGRDDATIRGAVVLVVAIVIGLALLARSGGGGDEEDASSDRSTTTTEATASTDATGETGSLPAPVNDTSTTTGPVVTADPATITVAVLNATPTVGLAGDKAALLEAAAYMTVTGNVAGSNTDTTMIYATPEAQADANAIKTLLDLGGAVVAEKPAEALGANGEDAEAQVVVVLGADVTGGGGGDTGTDTESTDTTLAE